jgi:hypothetical protein
VVKILLEIENIPLYSTFFGCLFFLATPHFLATQYLVVALSIENRKQKILFTLFSTTGDVLAFSEMIYNSDPRPNIF